MLNDEELVAQSKVGNLEAFSELVERYQKLVYTIAYRFLGDYEDACDAAQEAFVRAFTRLHTFKGDCSFKTWLCHIVANVCRDELRRYKRHPQVFWDDGPVAETDLNPQFILPEEALAAKEDEILLQNLLNCLPPEFRAVVVMRDIQGFSYEEIASQLGCSLGTVKSRLNRARKYLKEGYLRAREFASGAGVAAAGKGEEI
ncbi:MAG: polymerase sigma-70 factor, subfamily [Clostridia bacterium]|nr:polymerase sigma-70 factor, subfamily [Clostridia bacterium]